MTLLDPTPSLVLSFLPVQLLFISSLLGIGPYYKLAMMSLSRASHLPYNVPSYYN